MVTPSWADLLTEAFPKLTSEDFEIVEQPSEQYNCIAYAAGDTSKWWDHNANHYWPTHVTRSSSIESLKEVFAGLDFEQCQDSSAEEGYQKIALYEQQGVWTHAAVQHPAGPWRSKMGQGLPLDRRLLTNLNEPNSLLLCDMYQAEKRPRF